MITLKCKICGFVATNLISHIKTHNISSKDYKEKYKEKLIIGSFCKDFWINKGMTEEDAVKKVFMINSKNSKKVKNRSNPLSKSFWLSKGLSEDEVNKKIKEIRLNSNKNRKSYGPITINYWTRKGYDESFAKEKVREQQVTRSKKSKKFFGKHHTTKSKDIISQKIKKIIENVGIDKWHKHFENSKCYRSKGEVDLYNFVKSRQKSAKANMFVLKYNVDILCENKIIEFFGDYWHCNPKLFESKFLNININKKAKDIWKYDKTKINDLKKANYDVLVVWEYDWNNNKNFIKQKIEEFLDNSKT